MPNSSKSISSSSEDDSELRRGPWTLDEDNLLIHYINCHGEGRWNLLAKRSGLRRTGKSCRLRWLNYLKPDVRRGNLTPEEQLLILELHSKWGNRWSKIAQHLPGRTDNEIKNYWRTRVQKQARLFNIDINSTEFQDIIRCCWMPRLFQKMEESTSSGMLSQDSAIPQPLEAPHQDSAIAASAALAPLPVPGQGPFHLNEAIQGLGYHDRNLDSEHSISLSESMNISQMSQLSEYPTPSFPAIVDTDYDTYVKGCYYADNSTYEMEAFNLESMPAVGNFENSTGNSHAVENSWAANDYSGGVKNMDALWQLRN